MLEIKSSKFNKKTEETSFAGMVVKKTTTTTEQNTLLGFAYGKEREVSKKTEYLPNVSGKTILESGLYLAGKTAEYAVKKKLTR